MSVGRDNNFNLIRMLLAITVLASHAWAVVFSSAGEPRIGGFTPGILAVMGFLGISGFLVTQSWMRRQNAYEFAVARVLRIYPAMAMALCGAALVIGPMCSSLALLPYFTSPQTAGYLLSGFMLSDRYVTLPGVFADAPFPDIVNGPLWTLYYEAFCYYIVLMFGVFGLLTATRFWSVARAYAVIYLVIRVFVFGIAELPSMYLITTMPFLLGAAIQVLGWKVRFSWACASLLLAYASVGHPLFLETATIAAVLVTIWASSAGPAWLRRYNALGDYSYGTYVYGFPIQQAVVHFMPGIGPLGVLAISLPITLGLAAASWRFIEQPAVLWGRGYPKRRYVKPLMAAEAA